MTDTFSTPYSTLKVNDRDHRMVDLNAASKALGLSDWQHLPYTLTVLLENLLRHLDRPLVDKSMVSAVHAWLGSGTSDQEVVFHPSRVLMQDFTGVPAVVDLAAMRDALAARGSDPAQLNPQVPVDLVIDHSVQVDHYADPQAFQANVTLEMQRNEERYRFLKWGQASLDNFRVVPPGTGICHQVNLEHLAACVHRRDNSEGGVDVFPDTLVGTDSHTTMINGLGVLGWGVGGIEAEAAILGQPIAMRLPEVVGVRLEGQLPHGVTATDLVLHVVEALRQHNVVGKFVEFTGPALTHLSLPERATLANMAPEYGATCGFFPIDEETLTYLDLTGRSRDAMDVVRAYAQANNLWHDAQSAPRRYTSSLTLNLQHMVPSVAGPKRPQDRVDLDKLPAMVASLIEADTSKGTGSYPVAGQDYQLSDGDVIIAAITSCTNTSNPHVMLAAGLVAQRAQALGLTPKPWVKTSLAPGSRVVMDYLKAAGLDQALSACGFDLVGYGCTTCIGNSGPLHPELTETIERHGVYTCSVLSGNRNFEGRIHPLSRANWLASPPWVVLFALAGTTRLNLTTDPIGHGTDGPVYLHDLWPTADDIHTLLANLQRDVFVNSYASMLDGTDHWQTIPTSPSTTFPWDPNSTYVQHPPFFEGPNGLEDVVHARALAVLGDSVTTDHISPAGHIPADSPAGAYLIQHGVEPQDFNSYGSRRGNHNVMMRGTFANIRLQNKLAGDRRGGWTRHAISGAIMPLYDVAMSYAHAGTPSVILAGKEYGTGSSRDWAAKGTRLLGVACVIAESFERIHRSNLVGMGVLPCELVDHTVDHLQCDGTETLSIEGVSKMTSPNTSLVLKVHRADGSTDTFELRSRIDTSTELAYLRSGGILRYVLDQRDLAEQA